MPLIMSHQTPSEHLSIIGIGRQTSTTDLKMTLQTVHGRTSASKSNHCTHRPRPPNQVHN